MVQPGKIGAPIRLVHFRDRALQVYEALSCRHAIGDKTGQERAVFAERLHDPSSQRPWRESLRKRVNRHNPAAIGLLARVQKLEFRMDNSFLLSDTPFNFTVNQQGGV